MKLKYNLIAWSLFGFFAAACDPMDDIYNEIDAEGTTNTQTMAEYVLTDADYETISSAAGGGAQGGRSRCPPRWRTGRA